MNLRNISKRDLRAALVGAGVCCIVFAIPGCGPWRYRVSEQGPRTCVVDSWTGRARFFQGGYEIEVETVHDRRRAERERLRKMKARVEQVREGAAVFDTRFGQVYHACPNSWSQNIDEVPVDNLEDYLERNPDAKFERAK